MPELAVITGFSSFTTFCWALGSKINDKILNCHCSLSKKLPTLGITKKTDFNAEVDRAENQNISSTDVTFRSGTRIRLTQEQGPKIVTLLSSRLEGKFVKFTVCLLDGTLFTADHTQVAPLDDVDIASIPVSAADYAQESAHLTTQKAEAVAHPKPLSALSQEFLSWHNRMQHFPMMTLLALSKLRILLRCLQHIKRN